MSQFIPNTNGTCPCRACQAALNRTPAQRERIKRRKIIDKFTEQMARIEK